MICMKINYKLMMKQKKKRIPYIANKNKIINVMEQKHTPNKITSNNKSQKNVFSFSREIILLCLGFPCPTYFIDNKDNNKWYIQLYLFIRWDSGFFKNTLNRNHKFINTLQNTRRRTNGNLDARQQRQQK